MRSSREKEFGQSTMYLVNEKKKNNELSFCTSNATANSKHVKQLFCISAVDTMPVVTDFFLIT